MPLHKTIWTSGRVVNVHLTFNKVGDEHFFLITSDSHWDSKLCDRDLMKQHLDEMVDRRAGWIDNGDLFDLMSMKRDPRSSHALIRPEHRGDDYFDRITKTATEWFRPYAKNVIVLGTGNHETAAQDHHGVNITERLCARLNAHDDDARAHQMGIEGWVLFRCHKGRQSQTIRLYRHHGWGGDSAATKGITHIQQLGLTRPDAHLFCLGHNHNEYAVTVARQRISDAGVEYEDEAQHIRVPGYMKRSKWAEEKGHAIKPRGAAWLRVYMGGRHSHRRFCVEVLRAK